MKPLHAWDLKPEEAVRVQAELRQRLKLTWDKRPIQTVGGTDMSLTNDRAHAAIVVFRFPELTPVEGVTADEPLVFPYIPGLLAFREGPAILAAWERLKVKPDLLMFDGQGIAHPRGLGIASQMGIWLERPTIGVAKSRLYGTHGEPGPNRDDSEPLYDQHDKTKIIGAVLRTREHGNPLYISPGHLTDVEHALDFVKRCCTCYRLPETTRWAHKFAAGEPLPGGDAGANSDADQLSLL